jgi:hypothetical protein
MFDATGLSTVSISRVDLIDRQFCRPIEWLRSEFTVIAAGESTLKLDNAILAHHVWKNKLRAAIASKSQLDAAAFGRDDCCEIGQWLYGEGGALYGAKPQFTTLVEKHKSFHVEAEKIATQINAANYAQAARMTNSGTPFATASLAVAQAVNALKQVSS